MKDYFNILSLELQGKAELIKEYFKIHSGENGRNKEDILLNFLRSHLPQRYSIGTGFIFDTNNEKSNQNDLIIYDSFWSNMLFPDNVSQMFPIESVYGIIEVKSTLNQTELRSTIQKAKKIKKMPAKGISREIGNSGFKEPLYSIFAYDSIDLANLKSQLEEEYKDTPLNERIDFIIILNKGLFYTGNYFDVVKYGQENSEYRRQLGVEGIDKIKKEFPIEIEGLKLNENSLLVWYMHMMTYLSYSNNKISNWIDYLPLDTNWGEKIK